MKGIYVFAIMMFLGLFIMFYSQYRVMNIVGQRNVTAQKSEYPALGVADPEIMPYVTGSFVGLGMFVVGAIGGVIVMVKTFTNRF